MKPPRSEQGGAADELAFLNEIGELPFPQEQPEEQAAQPKPKAWGRSPTRAELQRRRLAALGLAVAWLAGHIVVYGVRGNFAQLPASYVLLQIALPMLLGVASLVVALSPGRWGLGLTFGAVFGFALLGPVSFVLMALGVPVPLVDATVPSWADHFLCLDLTLVWMSVPLLLAALNLRRAFASAAVWRSALLGGACGLVAAALMNLHCASVTRVHLLFGHALPVVLGCLLGGLLLSRWLKT
jgi:hypothetical protein